jgi:hypothetical protein
VTPGYHKIPAEKYHADPCAVASLNTSTAKILLRESARKAWFSHPRLNPAFARKEESKFDIGTAAHAMLLEGLNIIQVCEFDDWRTKDARAMRDAARAAGKVPLLKKHRDDVVAMVAAAEAFIQHSEIAEYWPDGESELTAICEERGVWMRCLLDRITKRRRFIFDYKSTEDASPDTFGRQIVRMGYHIQEAFYRRVVRNLGEARRVSCSSRSRASRLTNARSTAAIRRCRKSRTPKSSARSACGATACRKRSGRPMADASTGRSRLTT